MCAIMTTDKDEEAEPTAPPAKATRSFRSSRSPSSAARGCRIVSHGIAVVIAAASVASAPLAVVPVAAMDATAFGAFSFGAHSSFGRVRRSARMLPRSRLRLRRRLRRRPRARPWLSAVGTVPDEYGSRDETNDSRRRRSTPRPPSSKELERTRRDLLRVGTHLLTCLCGAVAVSAWEDYDCSYLKPESTALRFGGGGGGGGGGVGSVWGASTGGMGRGQAHRLRLAEAGEASLPDVPSYNEIMEEHRRDTVPRWERESPYSYSYSPYSYSSRAASARDDDDGHGNGESGAKVLSSVASLYVALHAVLDLKPLVSDYAWDDVRSLLDSPALNADLERAASALRSPRSGLPTDARSTIGFHWGSCAWRSCGALADAQEALSELRARGTGLYEPFECLFVLDVVERSLRDMLAAVPEKWHGAEDRADLPDYEPYRSQSEKMSDLLGEEYDPELDDATIDVDFLNTLKQLRSSPYDEDKDDVCGDAE